MLVSFLPSFSLTPYPTCTQTQGQSRLPGSPAAGLAGTLAGAACRPIPSPPALLWPPPEPVSATGLLGFTSDLGKDVQGPGSKERQGESWAVLSPRDHVRKRPWALFPQREQRQLHVPAPPPNTALCCLEVKEKETPTTDFLWLIPPTFSPLTLRSHLTSEFAVPRSLLS